MTVVEALSAEASSSHSIHEVSVDVTLLGDWASPMGNATAVDEWERVRHSLIAAGVAVRSATRIASAMARFAFLTGEGCDPSRRVLWRLHVVDGIPPDILAGLTWQHVRPRLREIAVPGAPGTRYFALSAESCRLLMILREREHPRESASPVFVHGDGRCWQPETLTEALALISVR